MPPVMAIRSVDDTELFQRLRDGFKGRPEEAVADDLCHKVRALAGEAADHMKAVPILMPQYTLHDSVHLLRVTELMARVAGRSVEQLNPVELALLILSANFHDHGMVLSGEDVAALEANPDYQLFRDNWRIEHPNLRDIEAQLRSGLLGDVEKTRLRAQEAELLRGMTTDYIRRTHAGRSRDIIGRHYHGDPRWSVSGAPLHELVGLLCESHGQGAEWMTEGRGFHHDRDVATFQVNVPYLGVLLRLADILDLDRDRTPDLLYKAIHFTSTVSVAEWEKHRSVQGWTLRHDLIRYTMAFEHPVYERTARRFMDWIDEELVSSHAVVARFPKGVADKHRLDLPPRVDRSRMGPRDNAYRYHDLEFSLSRDELVKLLMTDKLYSSSSLCVRELLQNALDALRYRRALFASEKLLWTDGIVRFEHRLDADGHEVVTCTDTGVGMDEAIIERFLTRAGRSFYRSPEFERERVRFRAAGVDFDPCAKFGIGFMSVFMLGDRIRITTRRDYGPGRTTGEPLVVDINGVDSLLVIRRGPENQPIGTTIEITGRKKPALFDHYVDRVRLCAVIEGYALATDFPVDAECSIDGIRGKVSVPANPVTRRSVVEAAGINAATTLVQPLAEIDVRLQGEIRASFLVDERGLPTTSNSEASWQVIHDKSRHDIELVSTDGTKRTLHDRAFGRSVTCVDGILIAGTPGRGARRSVLLGERGNPLYLGDTFVLDVRGALKPELTPAREPPDSFGRNIPSWQRLQSLLDEGQARLWERVTALLGTGLKPDVYWMLSMIHAARVNLMRADTLWSHLKVPVSNDGGGVSWVPLRLVNELRWGDGEGFRLADGRPLEFPPEVKQYAHGGDETLADRKLRNLLGSMATAALAGNEVSLRVREPYLPSLRPGFGLYGSIGSPAPTPVRFEGDLARCISLRLSFENVNRDHPVTRVAIDGQYLDKPSDVQVFARGIITWLTDSEFQDALATGKTGNTWSFRWLAHHYKALDWTQLPADLAPPYYVWLGAEKGILEITRKHFERWLTLRPTPTDRDANGGEGEEEEDT